MHNREFKRQNAIEPADMEARLMSLKREIDIREEQAYSGTDCEVMFVFAHLNYCKNIEKMLLYALLFNFTMIG